jgi:hypothetical protein
MCCGSDGDGRYWGSLPAPFFADQIFLTPAHIGDKCLTTELAAKLEA